MSFDEDSICRCHNVVFEGSIVIEYIIQSLDLPSLQSITMKQCAFEGDDNANRKSLLIEPYNYKNSLTMKSNNRK